MQITDYDPTALDHIIQLAQTRGDKSIVTSLIKAKNEMVLRNLIAASAANVKLAWRNKCEALNINDIKVEF